MEIHHGMSARIAKQRGPGGTLVRRWFTMLCIALFMLTNVGHAAACIGTSANIIISDMAFGAPDDDSGASKQIVPDQNHCHGCAAVSIPAMNADISPIVKATQISSIADYRVDADQRPCDPPPPKSLS